MRDRETIDSELRRLAMERRLIREHGGELSSRQLDDLLDERLGHRPEPRAVTAVQTRPRVLVADRRRTYRRPGALRRFALRTAIPLSIAAIATVLVVTVAFHYRHRVAQPAETPQSDVQPHMAAAQPPAPPVNHPAPQDIADKALIDVLQHEGVPAPSHDYVTTQAHAVCDFLAREPDLVEAAHFVQRSTIWDADQSAEFASAAVVTYCPQFATAGSDKMQQTLQTSQSTLQKIEGDLHGINNDLQGIRDGLHGDN
ncbi:hypothetical protein GCM10009641_39400 [Mycobacterium cookii]|uniref:DUF732 domain-containing protein n=1 Tax=Mycobacterium cookii TaxID=1775 RepID=A0A7I7KZI1_9MYCO|nr:DUF732 domain-containing protein [Mycobacterium cookii]MCV7331616.1 DUF732 domain-containing protein [Mycobacterium cookii]BBX46908.1 hypothetical protein MCOO_29230 [Mycobacterium cookii]